MKLYDCSSLSSSTTTTIPVHHHQQFHIHDSTRMSNTTATELKMMKNGVRTNGSASASPDKIDARGHAGRHHHHQPQQQHHSRHYDRSGSECTTGLTIPNEDHYHVDKVHGFEHRHHHNHRTSNGATVADKLESLKSSFIAINGNGLSLNPCSQTQNGAGGKGGTCGVTTATAGCFGRTADKKYQSAHESECFRHPHHHHRHDHSSGGSSRSGSSTDITDVLDDSCLSSVGSSALSSPCSPPPPLPLPPSTSSVVSQAHKTSALAQAQQASASTSSTTASTSSLASSSSCSSSSSSDRSLLSCCSCSSFSDFTPSSPSCSSESSTPPPPLDSHHLEPEHNKHHQSGSSTVDYVGLKPRATILEAPPPPRRMTFAETLRYLPPHPPPPAFLQTSSTQSANQLFISDGASGVVNGGHDYGSMFDHDRHDAQLTTNDVNSRNVLNGSESSSMASSCSVSSSSSCESSTFSASDAKDHLHSLDHHEQEEEELQHDIEVPRTAPIYSPELSHHDEASSSALNGSSFGSPSIAPSGPYYVRKSPYYPLHHNLFGPERCKQWLDGPLTDLILKTYTHRRQPKTLLDYKCQLQDLITRCLSGQLLDPQKNKPIQFKIYLVGSSLTSIGSMRSDIDLCMVIYDRDGKVDERFNLRFWAELLLEKICDILERDNVSQKSKVIRANVPILKFFDKSHHIEVNLNLNKLVTVQNTMLLVHLCSLDSRVAPFLFIVKLWAQKNGINCAFFKSLSSYSLSLMAIFFLQNISRPAILPPFNQLVDYVVKSTSLFQFQQDFPGLKHLSDNDQAKQMHVTSSVPMISVPLFIDQLPFPPPPPPPPLSMLNSDATHDQAQIANFMFMKNAISKVTFLDSSGTSQPALPLTLSCPSHAQQAPLKWSKKAKKRAQQQHQQDMEHYYYWFYYYYYYNSMLNGNNGASSRLLTSCSSGGSSMATTVTSSSSSSANSESDRSSISSANSSSTASLPSPSWHSSNSKGVATERKVWNNQSWTLNGIGGDHNLSQQLNIAPTSSGVVSHDIDGHWPAAAPPNDNCLNCLDNDDDQDDDELDVVGLDAKEDTDLDCEGASASSSTNNNSINSTVVRPHRDNGHKLSNGGLIAPATNQWTQCIDERTGSSRARDNSQHRHPYHQYHHTDLFTCDNTKNTTCCDNVTCNSIATSKPPPIQLITGAPSPLINGQLNSDNAPNKAQHFLRMMQPETDRDELNHKHSKAASSFPVNSSAFKSCNTQSLGSLFADFIAYYSDASIFDSVISIRTGKLMKRTDPVFARSSETSMETFICIEEPFNHTNTSHSVHNDFMFNFICKSFRWTRESIQKMKLTLSDFV